MEKIKSIKGTQDLLPADSHKWQFIENKIDEVCRTFGFKEIRTPIFENTALFKRGIGELTDVVSKEMYTFNDRSENSLTLRPEMTASVMRSFIQHNLNMDGGVQKLYYVGAMFRAENVQKGRLRQFHQWGAELVGSPSPLADVEIIQLVMSLFNALGLKNLSLKINSVGDENCRPAYKEKLKDFLRPKLAELCTTCQNRFETNPMRILDCKNPVCHEKIAGAPMMVDNLDESCQKHFDTVLTTLKKLNIPFEIDPMLVRGLDYYTKTAFEVVSNDLGSQNSVGGAGRYDLLIEQLGGNKIPAVGFAVGIERLVIIMDEQKLFEKIQPASPKLFVAGFSETHIQEILPVVSELRSKGISVEVELLGRSLKAQMREADRLKAEYSVVIGDNEISSKSAKIKHMATGNQEEVPFYSFVSFFDKQEIVH